MADVSVKGLAELGKFLDTLAPKLQRNVLRQALRAGANVIKPAAKANVHSVSGQLARGLKVSTGSKGGVIYSKLKATGKHAHIAVWLEYGTKAHFIKAKNRKALKIGDEFAAFARSPGARPKPFLRPALDQQAAAAVVAVGEAIKARLTKEGLDGVGGVDIGAEP